MSADDEMALTQSYMRAMRARRARDAAIARERDATIRFIREALRQQKSWQHIGYVLGMSPTGARRHYERNRLKVGP